MNFNLVRYSQPALDLAAKVGVALKRKAPELLACAGVLGFGATVVTACKATTKLDTIKAEAHEKLEEIDTVEAKELSEYTHEDAQRDRGIVKVQTAAKVAKLYAPSILLGVTSLSCFFGSHYILRKRNMALSAVAIASDKAFKEYREKVAEKFGKEVENELRYGLVEKEYETEEIDEKGKTITKKEKITASRKDWYMGQFDFFFDETVPGWEKDANLNKSYVLMRQDWANKELKRRYYKFHEPLTVNDVCDMFNIPRMPGGNAAGWWYDPHNQDHHIDFKIFDVHSEDARAFVNGLERSIRICLEPDTLDVWRLCNERRS